LQTSLCIRTNMNVCNSLCNCMRSFPSLACKNMLAFNSTHFIFQAHGRLRFILINKEMGPFDKRHSRDTVWEWLRYYRIIASAGAPPAPPNSGRDMRTQHVPCKWGVYEALHTFLSSYACTTHPRAGCGFVPIPDERVSLRS
jgi:hypothetical protein